MLKRNKHMPQEKISVLKRGKKASIRKKLQRKSKSRNKNLPKRFKDEGLCWLTSFLKFRWGDGYFGKDVIKKFCTDISIGKDKIGKRTKIDDSWVEIVNIITDEPTLIFVVVPEE